MVSVSNGDLGSNVRVTGSPTLRHLAIIGNALPRRCGLATFTTDTVNAMRVRYPAMQVDHYAMDDDTGVAYPDSIKTIAVDDPAAYREAAGLIEASGAEAIWLQHEFGIFGGDAGSYILGLLERSTLPLVVTLHTILEQPSDSERHVFARLLERAAHLIVMARSGRTILREVYGVADEMISVIPHGVPDRSYVDPDTVKARFGLEGRKVAMTFGLLGPNKGIQYMIEAMPQIIAEVGDTCFIVIGATHPNLVREQGESYRASLIASAAALGVADSIRFVDTFVEQNELLDWLEACDVYVSGAINLAQITSGTLSYAVALGKPVVSTPYVHAREILGDETGVLVPPRDADALAKAVTHLLSDDAARGVMAARAYAAGREMLWPRAMERAATLIDRALAEAQRKFLPRQPRSTLLAPDLSALRGMTDTTGIFQHGIFSVPDRNHGYCIDDNARALILACTAPSTSGDDLDQLSTTYASFIQHGWNPDLGLFRNFMRFDRSWCEEAGSEDSNGRTLWALGCAAAEGRTRSMRDWALHLFDRSARLAEGLGSPRALAFAALGAAKLISAVPGHGLSREILERTGDRLEQLLAAARRPDWTWFEEVLAYDNARLPDAAIRAGRALGRTELIRQGIETLDWLIRMQTNSKGSFQPVGTDSFGRRHAAPLPFDQQPLEAQATIDACRAAHEATGEPRWLDQAHWAYGWFTGDNLLGLPLASRQDGGCYDGLMPHGLNRNQGAESILALQLANVAISTLSRDDSSATRIGGAA
ncbi:MAG: glycosyltransferase family 4 protein [Sphingomicrobium sp.]